MSVRKERVSAANFVQAWQAVAKGEATKDGAVLDVSRQSVCEVAGMSYNAVVNREKKLRQLGVNLATIPHAKRGTKLDVDALNSLCK